MPEITDIREKLNTLLKPGRESAGTADENQIEENTEAGGKKKRVVFISRESDEPTMDIRMLDEELRRRGIETEILSKLFTKDGSSGGAASYLSTVLKQEAAIIRADVVVLDTYCIPASMIPHLGGTKIIQMWHALSAVKKFGWQSVGLEDGTDERTASLMRMHKGYDYVACASDVTAEYFCEAFRTDRSKIVKLALPRVDYIRSAVSGDARYKTFGAFYALHPDLAANDKKVVLYVPTFRKGSMPDIQGLADALDPKKYVLIVRPHPLYREETELPQADHILYEEGIATYDLLGVADVIISDYSSLVVEGTLADKPMYIYAYDIDKYRETTGLNMDFASEPIGKYTFTDAKELAAAMDRQLWVPDAEDDAYVSKHAAHEDAEKHAAAGAEPYDMAALRAFRDKYIDVNTENCTGQFCDFIESLLQKK